MKIIVIELLTRILSFLDVELVISSIYFVIFVYVFMLIFDLYTGKQLCIPTEIYFHCVLTCFVKSRSLTIHILNIISRGICNFLCFIHV